MKKLDILITGVGGQGNILASDIIGEVAITAAYDVKKTDTLGMAQRGGSVISHIRIARNVYSPLIRAGEVDILLGFEKLEAARWCHYLKKDGVAIINNQAIPPLAVSLGQDKYPTDSEIADILRQRTEKFYLIDGTTKAVALGNLRTLNIFMLGCLSYFIDFDINLWRETISQHLKANIRQVNLKAFELGREEMKNVAL